MAHDRLAAATGLKRKRNKISKAKRRRVYEKCGWRCFYCDTALTYIPKGSQKVLLSQGVAYFSNPPFCSLEEFHPQIDHKIPLSNGGKNVESNLVCCCAKCNRQKGNKYSSDNFLALKQKRSYS